MKKTLLLSVVASTMIMAGGDIAPVEPAVAVQAPVAKAAPVAAPAAAPACGSGWKFNGDVGATYWTTDSDILGPGAQHKETFGQGNSLANAVVSLNAVNSNVIGGIGAGVELVGIGTLGLEEDIVSDVIHTADGNLNGAAINQAYLTYGLGNTTAKVGRQTLPKSLSPLAFSENGHSFTLVNNTYEAALLVNSDLPATTLVGAWVRGANNFGNHNSFNRLNESDGVYMLTAQNKSIDGLTLTGTGYYGANMIVNGEDVMIGWLDAAFALAGMSTGVQAGWLDNGLDDTTALGAKIGFNVADYGINLAVSNVNLTGNATSLPVFNIGGRYDNALYTTILNNALYNGTMDNTTGTISTSANLFGQTFGIAGSHTELGDFFGPETHYSEADVSWGTKIGCTDVKAAYIWADGGNIFTNDSIVKVLAKYNF